MRQIVPTIFFIHINDKLQNDLVLLLLIVDLLKHHNYLSFDSSGNIALQTSVADVFNSGATFGVGVDVHVVAGETKTIAKTTFKDVAKSILKVAKWLRKW